MDLSQTISCFLGADDVANGKPDPEPANRIMDKFNIKPTEAVVVGDTSFDIDMGRNAGTLTCGVTYGNGSRESLSHADFLIDDFSRILELIP